MPTVIDTTVISNFALANALELLKEADIPGAVTTRSVLDELERGQELGRLPPGDLSWLAVVDLDEAETQLFTEIRARLGAGEASCLAVALKRGAPLLTDDLLARKMARRQGVVLSGTIGVMVGLVESSRLSLSDGNAVLAKMIEAGYFAPFSQLDEFIESR